MTYHRYSHQLQKQCAKAGEQGFTIVELMIALSIIAVILVISTVVLINLGVLYTKGTNQANTQNTTRNIVNGLASQLELGNADPQIPAVGNVICLGSQRYTFVMRHELTSSNSDHALWRDTMKSSATCTAVDLSNPNADPLTVSGSGTELLSPNMELTDFSIVGPPATPDGTYSIKVTVAYGDPTLLKIGPGKTNCTGDTGTQYCAVSSLTQNVARRSQN